MIGQVAQTSAPRHVVGDAHGAFAVFDFQAELRRIGAGGDYPVTVARPILTRIPIGALIPKPTAKHAAVRTVDGQALLEVGRRHHHFRQPAVRAAVNAARMHVAGDEHHALDTGMMPQTETKMKESRTDPAAGQEQSEDDSRQNVTAMPQRNRKFDKDDPESWGKVQRNAPCPCGSGKKFKQCHGKIVSNGN